MKRRKFPYIREILVSAILSIIYGVAYLVTGQACAIAFYQPQTPDKLYKTNEKETSYEKSIEKHQN